jgi:hypothetical protein
LPRRTTISTHFVQVAHEEPPDDYRLISAERARLGATGGAGLPGVVIVMAPKDPTDHTIVRTTMAFSSDTAYEVICGYDQQAQKELLAGCQEIVSTFRLVAAR